MKKNVNLKSYIVYNISYFVLLIGHFVVLKYPDLSLEIIIYVNRLILLETVFILPFREAEDQQPNRLILDAIKQAAVME